MRLVVVVVLVLILVRVCVLLVLIAQAGQSLACQLVALGGCAVLHHQQLEDLDGGRHRRVLRAFVTGRGPRLDALFLDLLALCVKRKPKRLLLTR